MLGISPAEYGREELGARVLDWREVVGGDPAAGRTVQKNSHQRLQCMSLCSASVPLAEKRGKEQDEGSDFA